jgi:hypothetical protein
MTPRTQPSASILNTGGRPLPRVLAGAAAIAAFACMSTGSASAQVSASDTTDANVNVGSAITLTDLTPSFELSGMPGAIVEGLGVVTYTVETNNVAGYSVTVQSRTATMVATAAGNADSIPIAALTARDADTGTYAPLSSTTTLPVHSQAMRSAAGGDNLATDFKITIPFVNSDVYTATLDYVATTL